MRSARRRPRPSCHGVRRTSGACEPEETAGLYRLIQDDAAIAVGSFALSVDLWEH